MDAKNRDAPEQVGYDPATWARAAGIGRATLYTLPPELTPRSIRIGRRRVIVEAPRAWAERVARQQAAGATS